MTKLHHSLLAILLIGLFLACKNDVKDKPVSDSVSVDSLLQLRYQKLLEYPVDSVSFPRSFTKSTSTTRKVPSKDWTSGFFPGNLWQLYMLTGNEAYKIKAIEWTALMEKEKNNGGTHDMGFKIYCSFGNGYEITADEKYKEVIVRSAQTLSTRFNENVSSIRSWDFNRDAWEFPVIIDNMMNLELLFEATRITGDSTYHKMAVRHANTTLKNHYREDNSSVHVVVYDTITGAVKEKVTHQGLTDESSWARGQAWGIYGFTMSYRYTKNPAYLEKAKAATAFFLNHPNLPQDGIPYWDFDDPAIPNAPRDVSAGSIVASALLELATYHKSSEYLSYSHKVLNALQSKEYLINNKLIAPFILDHSTGNWPKKDEMDEPIVYGDYYFLEALLRTKSNQP
ncbi:glucuronyl hydrolase [Maribacter algarum]|uniref:Glucuronyl hydrolase n=1 Tax=Maribacter algarum (ex Zhang et al. 2020) TaxID=2578118 RepID=A0A5S3PQ36_9FLAO|nr:glycoside hydrolase family 88 protein [Maribacter algarum]TMM55775.1 glucuronyl hydrolase [Maribacter algarum]